MDLPEPFGPIRPMRSPSEMVKETFWKSGFAPKAFGDFLRVDDGRHMGGNDCGLRSINVLLESISFAKAKIESAILRLLGEDFLL